MNAPEERQKSGKEEIVRRLERRPEVKARVLRLLDMVENTDGDLKRADEAERRAIEELRALGRELPQSWAQGRVSDEVATLSAQDGVVQQVKKLYWHSAFGDIEVIEPIYRRKADGKLERPFAAVAGVVCRGYSRPLQRAMADFGADLPFARVGEKLKERYGIVVALGAARRLTYRHARQLDSEDILPRVKPKLSAMTLIAEADGSMIPVARSGAGEESEPGDKRKRRALSWKEARLSLIRHPAAVDATYAVTLGDVTATGENQTTYWNKTAA